MGVHIGHRTGTAAHLLLRRVLVAVAVAVPVPVAMITDRRGRWGRMVGVRRLLLLLFGDLLDCHEALLAHLYPLRHITDGGVLCFLFGLSS